MKLMNSFITCLVITLMLVFMVTPSSAQWTQQVGPLDPVTLAAVGFGPAWDSSFPLPDRIVMTAVITGAPTTCTFTVQGTLKGINSPTLASADYENLATPIACDATAVPGAHITLFVNDKLLRTLRANLVSLVGGTSPTVTFTLMYRGQRN